VGTRARQAAFSINGGIAGLTGDGSEYWNRGFTAGGNGFFTISSYVMLGVRVSYNRWTPDDDMLVGDLGYAGIDWEVSGSRSAVEIAPSLRFLAPASEASPVTFFAQIGVGLYIMDAETAITASYAGRTETYTGKRSEDRIGVTFGAGIDIGYIEILPLYTVVATDEESTGYYSISAGAVFSF